MRQNSIWKETSCNVLTGAICRSVANAVQYAAIQCIDGDALCDFISIYYISYCNLWNSKWGNLRWAKFINRLAVAPCCHYALFVPPVIVNPVERCFLLPGFFFSVDRFCFFALDVLFTVRERPRCASRTATLLFANDHVAVRERQISLD